MSSDLFDHTENNFQSNEMKVGPLAFRMRPRSIDEFFGQEKVLGPAKPLRNWIETDRVPSLVFWGPPGCGKTTLAQIIARQTHSQFKAISAVLSGVKEIKDIVSEAREVRKYRGLKTILFVDEIHRFNKGQQDALLPHVEDGTLVLIGATTENPSFEINNALLSRARVIRLEGLDKGEIRKILQKALIDSERGLGGFFSISDEGLDWLAEMSEGDARRALTSLEMVALSVGQSVQNDSGPHPFTLGQVRAALESALERQPISYDRAGEEHYNVVSAFIKSLRDSDPHAGLYYLARMLEGGEDPLFIVRRMVIFASEDIGNADPRALQLAISVKEAVEFVGMPEARINLAQGVTYLALAPKSNASYEGINEAIEEVRRSGALPVPFHLRNAVTRLMKEEGYGKGYRYAHGEQDSRSKQTHLPDKLLGKMFYFPKERGLEIQMKKKLEELNSDFTR